MQLGRWKYKYNANLQEILFCLIPEPTGVNHTSDGELAEYRRIGIARFGGEHEMTKGGGSEPLQSYRWEFLMKVSHDITHEPLLLLE